MTDQPPPARRSSLLLLFDQAVAPIAVFTIAYIAALYVLFKFLAANDNFTSQTGAALAAVIATAVAVCLFERRAPWVITGSSTIARQCAAGIGIGLLLILGADAMIQLTSDHSRTFQGAYSVRELFGLLIFAAAHEELLLRGYAFERLARLSAALAIILTAILFAVMHMGNSSIGPIALVNLALGGIVLGQLRAIAGTIWLPFAFHWAWNAVSGSVLGHEVSGFHMQASLFVERDGGPELFTGGAFGIEASVFVTFVLSIAIVVAAMKMRRRLV
jgi:uncharacterized protein